MDLSTKIYTKLFLSTCCLVTLLIKPHIAYGQMKSSIFEPFKFELQERFPRRQ